MHTDLPLEEKSDDKLGRHLFAYEIASGLVKSFKDNNESIVLGINGTWGSGKTTLLNFIISDIKELSVINKQDIIVLRFNPWMFSGQKELQNIFLRELVIKLKNDSEKFKKVSKKIAELLEYLNFIDNFHSGIGKIITTLKNLFKKASKEKELTEIKKEIDDILIESKIKLYITIDDIDRLTPAEIIEIFQLIKLNGNFANTIFMLAYDQDVVETALVNQFGQNGKKYIEKIVQVDYTLPSISKKDISRLFIDNLSKLLDNDDLNIEIEDLRDTIKEEPFLEFITSIRDIYRFNNSIKLRLPSIANEINILDFLLVESLRIFEPKAYQFIINKKESLIYKNKNDINNLTIQSNNNKAIAEFIENSKFNELIKIIFKRLFLFDDYYTSDAETLRGLIRGRRIANRGYFDRYFNLQLSNFDIQESVFESFINKNSIHQNEKVLKQIHKKEQLYKFLRWLEIKSENSDESKLRNIIQSLLTFSKNLPYKEGMFQGIGTDLYTVLYQSSDMLYHINDLVLKRDIIIKYLENNPFFSSLYIGNGILNANKLLKEDKLHSKIQWYCLFKSKKEDNAEFIEKIVELRNSVAKELFDEISVNANFLTEDEIDLVLDIVYQNYTEHYEENFSSLIESDTGLIKFLWLSIKRNWMNSRGQVGYQLAEYQLLPGLNKEEIKTRLDSLNLDNFDENENKVIGLFKKAYEDGFKKDRYYNIETLEVMQK